MNKKIIYTAFQPTGNLHIGNYLGAVKNVVDIQNSGEYQCYIAIADLHSLTGDRSAQERHDQIMRTAAELIAAGVDPDRSVFYVQSHVAEHTELAWIFNTVTPVGELERMTQFKDKAGLNNLFFDVAQHMVEQSKTDNMMNQIMEDLYKKRELDDFIREFAKMVGEERSSKATVGLLTYPVLQAADILLYHGTHVPVGIDQVQHVELTRDIARWFNNRYGDYFPETKAVLTEIPKVMSLLEPTKKMSKSLGLGHVIEIADEPEVITKKLKKAVTASEGGDDAPGVENLLMLLKQFGSKDIYQQFADAETSGNIRYGDLKSALAESISTYFTDFRNKRNELLEDHDALAEILIKGAESAREVAAVTMEEVRKLVGIR